MLTESLLQWNVPLGVASLHDALLVDWRFRLMTAAIVWLGMKKTNGTVLTPLHDDWHKAWDASPGPSEPQLKIDMNRKHHPTRTNAIEVET